MGRVYNMATATLSWQVGLAYSASYLASNFTYSRLLDLEIAATT